jgi:Tfp pilus assembly protein PilF
MFVIAMTVAGCSSDNQTGVQRAPEPLEITDAPMPQINFETYVAAGDLAASRGQHVRAAEQYDKAAALRPDDTQVLRKLALAHTHNGQMTPAVAAWKKYFVATNESAESFGSLGYAYELAGNPTEAEKTYLAGIKKHPEGALVRINYGLMLVRRNKVEQAVEQMSAVLKPHEVNYNIASVYDQMGRRDLAQFYYRRALECNPNFGAARQKLTMVQ